MTVGLPEENQRFLSALRVGAGPMTAERIGKLVVVGVGLIGGSFALALKRAGGDGDRLSGVGRSADNWTRRCAAASSTAPR